MTNREQIIQRLNEQITGGGLNANMQNGIDFYRTTRRFGDEFAVTFYMPMSIPANGDSFSAADRVEERIADWILSLLPTEST